METRELIGPALDWAVAWAANKTVKHYSGVFYTLHGDVWSPSTDWSQGGPIIERELICYSKCMGRFYTWLNSDGEGDRNPHASGETLLVAAMRCYVSSKLGGDVDIPEELK